MGVEVRERVAGLKPAQAADKRFGDSQDEPLCRPSGLEAFIDRDGPLRRLDVDQGIGLGVRSISRRHRHPDVQGNVQERIEVEQLRELEEIAHVAARRGIARRDLDRDAGEPQLGAAEGSRRGGAGRAENSWIPSTPPRDGQCRW